MSRGCGHHSEDQQQYFKLNIAEENHWTSRPLFLKRKTVALHHYHKSLQRRTRSHRQSQVKLIEEDAFLSRIVLHHNEELLRERDRDDMYVRLYHKQNTQLLHVRMSCHQYQQLKLNRLRVHYNQNRVHKREQMRSVGWYLKVNEEESHDEQSKAHHKE